LIFGAANNPCRDLPGLITHPVVDTLPSGPSCTPCSWGRSFFLRRNIMRIQAEITSWREYWGFAKSETETYFVHKNSFYYRNQIPLVCVGSRIEFDVQESKSAAQVFYEHLCTGALRDDPTIGGHRNPRPSVESRFIPEDRKPNAVNIVLVYGEQDGEV
jgi:hypothetical protein